MRRLAWVAGGLLIIVSLVSAYAAYQLAGYSWDQVVSYETPYGDYDRPWADDLPTIAKPSAEDSMTPRLILVIVDGMRTDASRKMTGLGTLREYGADMVAVTPQPSLSYPTWTTILSGSPPDISGVTTNWFEDTVPTETLIDIALSEGRRVVAVGPEDFIELYEADRAMGSYFEEWNYFEEWGEEAYVSLRLIDNAIELTELYEPELVVIHMPDADEVAHQFGPESDEYAEALSWIDRDIVRLVEATQDDRTTFVIAGDHGHVDGGGHGGWEYEASHPPAIFVGQGVSLVSGEIDQVDIAPTTASLLGMRIPRLSVGRVLEEILTDGSEAAAAKGAAQYRDFAEYYLEAISGSSITLGGASEYDSVSLVIEEAQAERLADERVTRLPTSLTLLAAALAAIALVGAFSWRALVSVSAGTLGYYAFYNGLYFIFHGHQWSLSAFNTEDYDEAFFNLRMLEAVIAGLVGVVITGLVYPLLRKKPRGPRETYLGGWLALGPATIVVIQATLAMQISWFLWAWGADVVWVLPDLKWGFKYDLDLTQATALGAAVIISPLLTYLVGRYHPRVRRAEADRAKT